MITNIKSENMVIISDLHLGNPFSEAKKRAIPFLKWASQQGYDICINGDGLEIAQSSFNKIAFEVPELFRTLAEIRRKGRQIYYVTGNHDIALEHFLEDWGMMKVSPFLNVQSGIKRIRVEHGHIYDPFFIRYPRMYEALTHFAGYILKVHPQCYRLWIQFEKLQSRLRARRTGILGEHPHYKEAAEELSRRGFDDIIFGHTHHPGSSELLHGGRYYNPGSWMLSTHYVLIQSGDVRLLEWSLS